MKIISDLSICTPASALAPGDAPKKGCWRVVDFETDEGLAGKMLYAAPEDDAPEITLPLNIVGPHAIYVGINYTRSAHGDLMHYTEFPLYGTLWAKLSSDPGFSRFATEAYWRHGAHLPSKIGSAWSSIHETYWKSADLTGQSIVVRPPAAPYDKIGVTNVTNLSYVKVVPLDPDELARQSPPSAPDTRRLAILFCTGMLTGHTSGTDPYHPTDAQWIRDELAPVLDNDFGIVSWEAIRGNLCTFRTSIGDFCTEDGQWNPDWIDPLAEATRVAHEHGLKIFVSARMIGASLPVVRRPIQWAKNYWSRRDLAKRDPEGIPGSNLSIAYPEVRQFWVSLMREALDLHGCDGAQLHLNRGFPFVLYEEPSASAFRKRFGADMRDVAPDDPRMLEHQASIVTQLLREFRAMLDEKPGRALAVTLIAGEYGSMNPVDPLTTGCDVEAWVRERLVDYLMPTPAVDLDAIRTWKSLGGDRVRIYPDLMPRTQPGEMYARLARRYYDAGADGFCIWDGERRCPRASEWAVVRRLGHRDALDDLEREAPDYFRRIPLKTLNGMSVKYSFNDG